MTSNKRANCIHKASFNIAWIQRQIKQKKLGFDGLQFYGLTRNSGAGNDLARLPNNVILTKINIPGMS